MKAATQEMDKFMPMCVGCKARNKPPDLFIPETTK